jgi:hypothetical protein
MCVITASQIDSFPINGRNFLDLAQLEPGVQIQEGSTFDPTKNGFSSISFEGRIFEASSRTKTYEMGNRYEEELVALILVREDLSP